MYASTLVMDGQRRLWIAGIGIGLVALVAWPAPGRTSEPRRCAAASRPAAAACTGGDAVALRRRPVARTVRPFEANAGQFPPSAEFLARAGGAACAIDDTGFTVQLLRKAGDPEAAAARATATAASGINVRFEFEGAAENGARAVATGAAVAVANHYVGADPAAWRTAVRGYDAVTIRAIAPGIDVDVRSVTSERLEYDLLLAPGADLAAVVVACQGGQSLRVTPDGHGLIVATELGELRQDLPATWQVHADGSRQALACHFRQLDALRFGFEVLGRDPTLPLVIDPGLLYSTFLGGAGDDEPLAVAALPSGAVTLVGWTSSPNYPLTPGVFTVAGGGDDVFVSRLSADGTQLLWSTYLGGSDTELASGVCHDATGGVVVVGSTGSPNFPITPGAFRGIDPGATLGLSDGFVVRLTANGTLVFSTGLGDAGDDACGAVAIRDTDIVVGGYTQSSTFPTTPGAHQTSHAGGGAYGDGYVCALSGSGASLRWSTLLGGPGNDGVFDLAIDANGDVSIAGFSEGFVVPPGSFGPSFHGSGGTSPHNAFGDALVGKLSGDGTTLLYGGFLGSSSDDIAFRVALDTDGAAIVVGRTRSNGFPVTPGAAQPVFGGGLTDGFVAKISPSGALLVASTFLGGQADDDVLGFAVESGGTVVVGGSTASTNFPHTAGCLQPGFGGGATDAFVVRLTPNLDAVVYATLFGGSDADSIRSLVTDGIGGVLAVGQTSSYDLPTAPGAFDASYNGGVDGFVAHFDLLPAGVTRYGNSTAGCIGWLPAGVNSAPQIGNLGFAVTCGGAPPNSALGFAGFAASPLPFALPLAGANLWVDPTRVVALAAAASGSTGTAQVPVVIPNNTALVGARLYAQFVWFDACAPVGLSASNALELVVQ